MSQTDSTLEYRAKDEDKNDYYDAYLHLKHNRNVFKVNNKIYSSILDIQHERALLSNVSRKSKAALRISQVDLDCKWNM